MNLNKKIKQIQPSATLKITAMAKKMKKEGLDVISFGAGEPDYDTPQYIKDAAIKSINNGETKYTPASGTDELKSAVVEKLQKENNLQYANENIIISCGAKHSIYNIIQVIINDGDEVILFAPYWVSYIEQIRLAGGTPVIVDTTVTDFKLNLEELKKKISKKTKLIIINSPQNPSGVVYSKEELTGLAKILKEHEEIVIISDEIYEKLIYSGLSHYSIAQIDASLKERLILVNGLSKTYSMTGWRIGYLAAPVEVAKAVSTLQSHSTSNPTTFCQKASVTAMKTDSDDVKKMIVHFEKRRDLIYGLLNEINGFEVIKPEGSFYIFPKISMTFNKKYNGKEITDSTSFAQVLLEEKNVAVVPGVAFGCDNYIRLSFATSDENIKNGVQRIKEFTEGLS
ncbi:MAG: pyridoxal phosphate-dependent aminotransferase [Spirochaetes bacterium]|nr:pyridoxal phosphate-dependent aminotransferase [Spirochaetota bacterium]